VAAFSVPLSPGVVIQSIAFEYEYITGYNTGIGANFTLKAANVNIYSSPHYTDYSYNANRSNYSNPVPVDVSKLSVKVPASGESLLEFVFDNNDRNIQLLLPLQVNMTCTGGPCGDFPLLPTFIDSNMVLQRAPERAAIWGHNAVAGETATAAIAPACSSSPKGPWTATADATGAWAITLDPQEARWEPDTVAKYCR
jgi:hypothetical protein